MILNMLKGKIHRATVDLFLLSHFSFPFLGLMHGFELTQVGHSRAQHPTMPDVADSSSLAGTPKRQMRSARDIAG